MLDKQLSVGPLNLNIADLGLTDDIQDKLNDVPKIIQAIVAMYIIAAIFIILSLFGSCGAVALIPNPSGRTIVMGNLGLAGGAVFFLLIGNLITTIGSGVVVDKVSDLGDKFGLSAVRGGRFMALSWAAFVLMLLAVFYWVYELPAEKKRAHNRAIGGYGGKEEAEWSETDSGYNSRENSFPREQQQEQGYPPTHAHDEMNGGYPAYPRGGMDQQPVSPLSNVDLDEHEQNLGRGTHEPEHAQQYGQQYGQQGYGRY